ncbi:MAG: hypothetical protein VX613_05135 [Candidatus Thermoplasmatota archaeon]|nr:hypothetical protein [Candidatus Thermoplasmatota archaeon]
MSDSDYMGEALLPNPYGEGFEEQDAHWVDGLLVRSKQREKTRIQWGNFIQNPLFSVWRNSGPLLLSLLYLFPLFIPMQQILRIWLILLAALLVTLPRLPTLITLETTWKSAVDHLELIRRDEANEAVRPGAVRMLEELDDRRNVQKLHINLGLLAFFCAFIAVLQTEITLGPQLLLISASMTEMILAIQPIILRNWGLIPDLRYPMLSIYKPCQRGMNLTYPLTEVMEAHLDPWTKRSWRKWRNIFESKIRKGRVVKSAEDAIERLLLLEHLRLKKKLSDEEVESEKKTFLSEFDDIENPDLEYFLLHLYGQCPGLFHLIDGMIDELITNSDDEEWKLDARLYRHDYGAGADVFIRLTNYTSSKESVKLTITTPNAIPREQTTKIEILPTKVERNNCNLHDPLNENAIDSMTALTNESHLFWMSVSWANKSVNKVIVTLENENNEVLFEKELVMPSTSSNNVLWFRALNRIERLASQGGLIPL